ncbi:GGDEF domain-containing protein [Cyanobium sp. T1G-Tous]|uniref:GGDEF domain-containing protein n=1 Tax=Cyanobium sp. T1G-Tous TaxID=2823722 RepID=UPI0020CF05E8|nr:GGDEF domain-containing protein [Cyanobium sp. T1G-Tous]MCP9803429.1 GGDEF domain-containing protein [Cyanobium sp. T1G-Tous]
MIGELLPASNFLSSIKSRAFFVFLRVGVASSLLMSAGLASHLLLESNREVISHAYEIRSIVSTFLRLDKPSFSGDAALLSRYRLQHNDDLKEGINYILVLDSEGRIVKSSRPAWNRLLIADPMLARSESDDSQFRAIRNCFIENTSNSAICFKNHIGFYLPFAGSFTLALPVKFILNDRGLRQDNHLVVINFDPSITSSGFATDLLLIALFSFVFLGLVFLALAFALYSRLAPVLRRFIDIDNLTGLLNRRACMDMGMRLLSHGEANQVPYVLGILDLDNFKAINDAYGHQCGDFVLQEAAAILRKSLYGNDDLLARLGGEEFFVIAQCSSAHGLIMMDRLRAAVEQQLIQWQGRQIKLTVSIGVVSSEHFGYNLNHLYAQADAALYRAKEMGRNRVCSSSSVQDNVLYNPWSPGKAWADSFSHHFEPGSESDS